MSKSHANPPRTQDQQDNIDNKQPGEALEALHVAQRDGGTPSHQPTPAKGVGETHQIGATPTRDGGT